MEIVLTLLALAGVSIIILNLNRFAKTLPFSVSKLAYINTQLKFQTLLLSIALLVLVALYFLSPATLSSFFSLGNIAAPAKAVSWLGISEGESWLNLGASLSFFITLATATFVFLQFRNAAGSFKLLVPLLFWVVLFSLSNSFSEEVIYRLGVIVPLAEPVDSRTLLLISAVAFGLPHLRGMPNGIVGAVMAGFLGWLLAKSVTETNGIFWAWFIHSLQDVVIFSAFVMAADKKQEFTPRG